MISRAGVLESGINNGERGEKLHHHPVARNCLSQIETAWLVHASLASGEDPEIFQHMELNRCMYQLLHVLLALAL